MDDLVEREDVILGGLFDLNATLSSIDRKLAVLVWLDIGGHDEEEEEDDPLGPDS